MSERTVDREEVRHVADLARIDLEAATVDRMADQFGDILDHFDRLDEVPETDAEPELTNVLRPDEVHESLDAEEALQNAPQAEAGYFRGPRVS